MRRLVAIVGLVVFVSGCGGDKSPTAPTPPPPVLIAGTWSGTFESTNWAPQAIAMNMTQIVDHVNGSWVASPADWQGTLDGTVSPTQFTGSFTMNAPVIGGGPRCTGTGSFSGSATTTIIKWTSPGFSGSCTGMPTTVVLSLQKR